MGKTTHLFSADRPIKTRADDLLGRTDFADSLASAINNWRGKDSLVIALYGEWGSGKSSIKNMVCESLRVQKDPLIIVEFNPWEWAAQAQIIEAFFEEIGLALGTDVQSDEKAKKAAVKWRAYGRYLKLGGSIARAVKSVAAVTGVPPEAVDAIAHLLDTSGKVAAQGAEALDAKAEKKQGGLSLHRADLAAALTELERPVLVVMDDIDRLSRDEIKLLFQLVKANADLPNLVYLLLFQRDVVEKSLAELAPISGRDFLEKIVQVGFDVPAVDRSVLQRVLLERLETLLSSEATPKDDEIRFGNMFYGGLTAYFNSLRDVYRFLSTFEFHLAVHRRNGILDVNPTDLIGIEVLRVFEPEVFRRLPSAKHVITDQGQNVDAEEAKSVIDGLIDAAPQDRRESVREILKQLSTPIEWRLEGYGWGHGFEPGWLRDLRMCSGQIFDRYFQLTISAGDLSQSEVQELLRAIRDPQAFAGRLRSLIGRGLIGAAFDRIRAHVDSLDGVDFTSTIAVLFDIGDELPEEPRGFFDDGVDWQAGRLIHLLLKKEPDAIKRREILEKALESADGVFLPVFMVDHEKAEPADDTAAQEHVRRLREVCLGKIREAANDGTLARHRNMAYLVWRWFKWAGPDEPREWVAKVTQEPLGVLRFLAGIVGEGTTTGSGDRVSRRTWRIQLSQMEKLVSPDHVAAVLDKTPRDNLTHREREAIKAFERAMKRRQEGKGDGGPLSDDEE